jgi:hypothetical protein
MLLSFVKSHANSSAKVVIAAHNLAFDLGVLAVDYQRSMPEGVSCMIQRERIRFEWKNGQVLEAFLGRPCWAVLRWGGNRSVTFLDTYAYYITSLEKAAEGVGMSLKKFPHPKGFGRRQIARRIMEPYLRRDVELTLGVARYIVGLWGEYGVRPCISFPHLASRIFRHHFVRKPWVRATGLVERMAVQAYHGGKNGLYTAPGWYRRAFSYDLRSAYCWAMTQIPDMTAGRWETVSKIRPGVWGFYCISGVMPDPLPYPILFSHDFKPLGGGQTFENLCVTSVELDLLRERFPTARMTIHGGIVWRPTGHARGSSSDLSAFASSMWDQRQAAKKAGHKTAEKLFKDLANSLYGKFIERQEDYETLSQEKDPVTGRPPKTIKGSLFYAPVAAWITALVRCRITRLEYEHGAVHTSTDGIITLGPISSAACSAQLGGLKFEHSGPLLLVRNKCYLHFDGTGQIRKHALHGFQGKPRELWRLVQTGKTSYRRDRLRRWLESLKENARPYSAERKSLSLHAPIIAELKRTGRSNPFRLRPSFEE